MNNQLRRRSIVKRMHKCGVPKGTQCNTYKLFYKAVAPMELRKTNDHAINIILQSGSS